MNHRVGGLTDLGSLHGAPGEEMNPPLNFDLEFCGFQKTHFVTKHVNIFGSLGFVTSESCLFKAKEKN